MKRAIIVPALVTAFVALSPVGVALAAPNPSGTGQPNQDVDAQPFRPHGFLTGGFATAEEHYAGEGTRPDAAHPNAHAVSQYDVAGFQFSSRPGATQRP
jgi:hypothetical protein